MTVAMHVQCKLRRGNQHQTTWLPKRYARVGLPVDLKDDETIERWDRGWRVEATFTELPIATVLERAQDYKRTRKASDV
jgi:hypothetical protein